MRFLSALQRPVLTAVLLLAAVRPMDAGSLAGKQNRREFMDTVRAAFVKEDYASLEATVDELHAKKDRFPEGIWTLAIFYLALDLKTMTSEVATHFAERLERWKAAFPRSLAARIVEVDALQNEAWDGTGKGLPGGADRPAHALELLQEAETLTPNPGPEWFDAMLVYASRWGWERTAFDAIYQRAVAAEPGYHAFYFRRAGYLRNLGAPGEWEAYALEVGRQGASGEGMGIYSRIAWSLSEYYSDEYLFKYTSIQWPLMRDGFRELDRHWPNSDWNLNNFCRFACLAGDRDTARDLFARIGDRWTSNWLSHAAFKKWAAWAAVQDAPASDNARRFAAEDPEHPNAWTVQFAPDSGSVFAGYDGGRIVRWDLGTGSAVWRGRLGTEGSVNALATSPDGHWLAAGTAARMRRPNVRGEVGVWDLHAPHPAGDPAKQMEKSLAGVHSLRFSPDGRTLAAAGHNQITNLFGELRLWNVPDWKETRHVPDFEFSISSVAFLPPDNRRLAFAFAQSFDVVQTDSWAHVFWPQDQLHKTSVFAMDIAPDGKTLACATSDGYEDRDRPGEITFWNTADWTRRDSPHVTSAGGLAAMVFSPDGRWVAGGGYDGFLRVWDAATGKLAASWPPDLKAGKIDAVAFAPDGAHVAAAREDDAVTVYPFSPNVVLKAKE